MMQFGLLGPEDSDSFRLDSKPQPSNDLNIRLRDELQRCLTGEKQIIYIIAAMAWQQHSTSITLKSLFIESLWEWIFLH